MPDHKARSLALLSLLLACSFSLAAPSAQCKNLSDSQLTELQERMRSDKVTEGDTKSLEETAKNKAQPITRRVRCYALLCQYYFAQGKEKLASNTIEEALKLDGKSPEALAQRAYIHSYTSEPKSAALALKYYDQAIAVNKDKSWLYLNRGSLKKTQRQFKDAIADFDQADALTMKETKQHHNLALALKTECLGQLKMYQECIKLGDSIKNAALPDLLKVELLEETGLAKLSINKEKEAMADFSQALKMLEVAAAHGERKPVSQDEIGRLYYLRGVCHHKLKEKELANQDLNKALSLGFRVPGAPPPDRVVKLDLSSEKVFQPLIAQARKTLPEAKARFLKGLPKGYTFSVTTKIYDQNKKFEQVFVIVKSWSGDRIEGILNNEVRLPGYKLGQALTVYEKDVLDWTIVSPKGEEEGNLIGKFIDKNLPNQD